MGSVNAPFGLKPIYHPSGRLQPRALTGGIASGYAANLFLGSPVRILPNNGVINVGTTNGAIVGSFAGCEYTGSDGRRRTTGFWPASTVATNIVAYFHEDPQTVYAIQANGTVAQTAIGNQADLVNPGLGDTNSQVSTCTANSSLAGTGNQGTLRILDIFADPQNNWGDAYPVLVVQIARHQYLNPAVAI